MPGSTNIVYDPILLLPGSLSLQRKFGATIPEELFLATFPKEMWLERETYLMSLCGFTEDMLPLMVERAQDTLRTVGNSQSRH